MPSFFKRLFGVPQAAPTQQVSSSNRQPQSPVRANTTSQQDHQLPSRNIRKNERGNFFGKLFRQRKANASSAQVARPSYGGVPKEDMQRALRMSREEHDLQYAKKLSLDSFDEDSFDPENMRYGKALSMAEQPDKWKDVSKLTETEQMHLAIYENLEINHAAPLVRARKAEEMRKAVESGEARPNEAGELRRTLERRAQQEEGDLHFATELSMASEEVAEEMLKAVESGEVRPEDAGELRRALQMSISTPRASDGGASAFNGHQEVVSDLENKDMDQAVQRSVESDKVEQSRLQKEEDDLQRAIELSKVSEDQYQKQETQKLLDVFLASLQRIPIVNEQEIVFSERPPEEVDFSNQYVGAPSETKSSISRELVENKYGQILSNRGGGDCLFHALAGKDLSENEIIGLRARIAEIKRNASDEERDKNMNANQLVAGLSQTPAIGPEKAIQLMFGRHAIPNDVYAKFQAIPGMYAGEDELKQWTLLEDNKDKTVFVIDSGNQTLAAFKNGNRATIEANELDGQVQQANLLLYKTASHWEQIDWEEIVWKPIEKMNQ